MRKMTLCHHLKKTSPGSRSKRNQSTAAANTRRRCNRNWCKFRMASTFPQFKLGKASCAAWVLSVVVGVTLLVLGGLATSGAFGVLSRGPQCFDCTGQVCTGMVALTGDGVCDPQFNCASFGYDHGDCPPPSSGRNTTTPGHDDGDDDDDDDDDADLEMPVDITLFALAVCALVVGGTMTCFLLSCCCCCHFNWRFESQVSLFCFCFFLFSFLGGKVARF